MNKGTAPLLTGIIIIIVITVAVTGYSGLLTGRWGTFQGLDEARTALKALPLEIGDWKADKERELGEQSTAMLRIQNSYIFRTYRHTVTQEIVLLTIMVGPTGKITVHTPEICFGGKDYEKEAVRTSVPINVQRLSGDKEVADAFWWVNFVGRSLDVNNRISFYYAVSTGDAWVAIENARSTFQTYRYVYKLQAEAYSGSAAEGDNVQRFLIDCLPTIHEHLRPCR
jgi:hypothetical protein